MGTYSGFIAYDENPTASGFNNTNIPFARSIPFFFFFFFFFYKNVPGSYSLRKEKNQNNCPGGGPLSVFFFFFLYNNVPRAYIVRKVKSEKEGKREMSGSGMFLFFC